MLGEPVGVEDDAPRPSDTEFDGWNDHHGDLSEYRCHSAAAGIQEVSNRGKDLCLDFRCGCGVRGRPYCSLTAAFLRMRRLFRASLKKKTTC